MKTAMSAVKKPSPTITETFSINGLPITVFYNPLEYDFFIKLGHKAAGTFSHFAEHLPIPEFKIEYKEN